MKKLLGILLAVAMMMALAMPAMAEGEEIPTTGQLGESITWNHAIGFALIIRYVVLTPSKSEHEIEFRIILIGAFLLKI